jgi:hypothetical protein
MNHDSLPTCCCHRCLVKKGYRTELSLTRLQVAAIVVLLAVCIVVRFVTVY